MKKILLLFLIIGCSSRRDKVVEAKPFDKQTVCSPKALQYLKSTNRVEPESEALNQKILAIRSEMMTILSNLKACYNDELKRNGDETPFNMCFITGIDEKGIVEFSDFHTSEYKGTDEFYECLYYRASVLKLGKFKNTNIVQAFRFYPTMN